MDELSLRVAQGRIRRGKVFAFPFALLAGIGMLSVAGCSGEEEAPSSSAQGAARVKKFPRLASAPDAPRLMEVYFNTTNGREWIYDGVRWVPHDQTVDSYGQGQAEQGAVGAARSALTVPFSPTGAHTKHRAYDCTACHLVAGTPCLDPAGPAAAPGQPPPAFDAIAKTCSNVSCHGAYSGNFTYYRWDWGIEALETVNVQYAGSGGAAASWYSTGSTCSSCHGNPPALGSWHSPSHGFGWMTAARMCETCHPDAMGGVVGGKTVGVAINATNAAMHANRIVNVQARFTNKCFGCH